MFKYAWLPKGGTPETSNEVLVWMPACVGMFKYAWLPKGGKPEASNEVLVWMSANLLPSM